MSALLRHARAVGFLLPLLAAGLGGAPAMAADRYAAPNSARASGACAVEQPCSFAFASSGAVRGDQVILLPGDYPVSGGVQVNASFTLSGVAGQPRPRLIGGASSSNETLAVGPGATVRHLEVIGSSPYNETLAVTGGLAEDLVVTGTRHYVAELIGSTSMGLLRDSLVVSREGDDAVRTEDAASGKSLPFALRNVTAISRAGVAVKCRTEASTTSLVNVLARGGAGDINANADKVRCATSHSAYRPAMSPGVTPAAGDRAEDPGFVNASALDFRLGDTSPLIDAGTTDPLLGALDLDGRPRVTGSAPDIGGYEYVPGAAPVAPPSPILDGGDGPAVTPGAQPSRPALGKTVVVAPGTGTVLVRVPGRPGFTVLDGSAPVPTGALLDTRKGSVTLQTALPDGKSQTGTFRGGLFRVTQPAGGKGMTELELRGALPTCTAKGKASASAKKKRRPVRRLWASDRGGKFRTRGSSSVATARGTAWYTEDRCDGTLTRVTSGAVSVKPTRGKAVLVRAGHRLLVRTPTRRG
jgi:hypothetical protein